MCVYARVLSAFLPINDSDKVAIGSYENIALNCEDLIETFRKITSVSIYL